MTDFDYDCLQKKKIAGQAKYRKRGSKSKKCTLPSDRLTHKQWKDRCGPVVTYNFGKPMGWDDFKQMPVHIQAEYIVNLQKKFGATAVDLGDMFGVRALTVRKHAESNKLGIEFPRGHAMSAARKAEWTKFLGDEEDVVFNTEQDLLENTDEQYTDNLEDGSDDLVDVASNQDKSMSMKKFSLQFSGTIDVDMIANSLKFILGDKTEGDLEIIFALS